MKDIVCKNSSYVVRIWSVKIKSFIQVGYLKNKLFMNILSKIKRYSCHMQLNITPLSINYNSKFCDFFYCVL